MHFIIEPTLIIGLGALFLGDQQDYSYLSCIPPWFLQTRMEHSGLLPPWSPCLTSGRPDQREYICGDDRQFFNSALA